MVRNVSAWNCHDGPLILLAANVEGFAIPIQVKAAIKALRRLAQGSGEVPG
jgi:hypothetical protein